jgi:hypothetical protein
MGISRSTRSNRPWGSRRGALSTCFKELEARERLEERTGQFVSANLFDQHRRIPELRRSEQELRERCDDRLARYQDLELVCDWGYMIMDGAQELKTQSEGCHDPMKRASHILWT